MKRFHLFVGDWYYPSAYGEDYDGAYETLEAAQQAAGSAKRGVWAAVWWSRDDGELVLVAKRQGTERWTPGEWEAR